MIQSVGIRVSLEMGKLSLSTGRSKNLNCSVIAN
jgi:hypothetical protein